MSETLEYLNKKNIPYKQEGKEVVLICPNCNKPKLYMNIDSGIFHCFVCEAERPDGQFAKGNLYKLKEYYGDVVSIQGINDGVLNYPDRNKEDVDLTELVTQHHSAIHDNKRAIKYLYSRGIDEESIEKFKLGYVNRYNQEWLSIPIFESGIPKLIKYRQIPPFNKELDKYIREKDGKSILFNGDIINLYETIYIVEGELDAITLIQNGYENVISGTGGAGTLKSEWYDKLSTVPKLVLIFDPDSAGQGAARDVWAARLGKGRCYNLLMPEGTDINEFFLTHSKEDFEELLKSATRFKVDGLISIKEALIELYNKTKTDEFHDVFPTPWKGVNKLIGGGLKRGRLYDIAGNSGVGKCVKWDTKIVNPKNGYVSTIKDIVTMKNVSSICSFNKNSFKIEKSNISNYIHSGIQECYKVQLSYGRYIECPSHNKFFTPDGWKELKYLSVGDLVAVPKVLNVFGSSSIPIENARIIGYMISEGGTTHGTPCFTSTEEDMVSDLKTCLEKIDCKIKKLTLNRGIGYYLITKNTGRFKGKYGRLNHLKLILIECGLDNKYSYEKEIPDFIFSCNKEVIANMISTMWSGDGCIRSERVNNRFIKEVSYSTSSEDLAYQLQHLLLRFGINSYINKRKTKCRDNYIISINNKDGIIKFYENFVLCYRKQLELTKIIIGMEKFDKNCQSLINRTPKEYWKEVREVIKDNGIIPEHFYKEYRPNSINPSMGYDRPIRLNMMKLFYKKTNDERLLRFIDSDIGFLPIKSIKFIGEHDTYDLSVLGNECFIANDIIVHNSRMTLQLTYHMAKVHNVPCLYFCLEMPNTDLATVIVQLHEDLTYDEFEPADSLIYMMRLQEIPIYFGYSPKVTPDIFYNTMKEANARYGVEFGVFDNLHRMIRTGEEKDFAQASGMFKDLTLELNIPFVLVCQPRKTYSDRELVFDDIRGARAISDDADHILLMHRDRIKADEEGETVFSNETIITEDKSRYSESGRIKLWFNGSKSKFSDYIREDLNNGRK